MLFVDFLGWTLFSIDVGEMPKKSAALSQPDVNSSLLVLITFLLHLNLIFSGEAIYPTRRGPVGEEKPKHSSLPQTKETQVLPGNSLLLYEQPISFQERIKSRFLFFRSPVLVAEFLNGERHWQSLHNFSCDEVSFSKLCWAPANHWRAPAPLFWAQEKASKIQKNGWSSNLG